MADIIPHRAVASSATHAHKAFIREMILSQKSEGYIANCKAIEKATPAEYAKVKCPVLIIGADEDKSTPVSGCEEIMKGLTGLKEGEGEGSGKKLVVLKGVGHWYCVERPDEVGRLVEGGVKALK